MWDGASPISSSTFNELVAYGPAMRGSGMADWVDARLAGGYVGMNSRFVDKHSYAGRKEFGWTAPGGPDITMLHDRARQDVQFAVVHETLHLIPEGINVWSEGNINTLAKTVVGRADHFGFGITYGAMPAFGGYR